MQVKWVGCPASNFRPGRPQGLRPEAIVIHIIDGSFAAGESVFLDPASQKSAHYAISKNGEIHQYVDENDTAFHAGVVVNPTWDLLKKGVNPNFYTIGIEHEGKPQDEWPNVQLSASAALVLEIAARWGILLDPQHVIRHHQIRASKTCPGNWLTIDNLLAHVPRSSGVTLVATASVQTVKHVNLRAGRPNTTAPVVRVIPSNTAIAVAGFTLGERVQGNANWYADAQGNYLWAGATNLPDPKPSA
ncbi:MAG: peptidoglycan recognition family protein [Candidatus Korobacteraceae bacterium]